MGQKHSTPAVCPELDSNGPDIQPIAPGLTFHRFSVILSGAAALFATIIALFLIMMHATHFSQPRKQKQIIRIACILPSFALVSFLVCCYNGNAASYILPALDVSEALPMASFFLLLTEYVVPDGDLEGFYAHFELQDKRGNVQPGGSATWYRKLAFGVTQWLVVSIVLWIATAASLAAGTYCATSNNIHFAHIWITIIRVISVAMAVVSILKFYRRTSSVVKPQGALKQFFCVKGLVFLNFVQTFIFNILKSSHALHPTSHLTLNDLSNSIPSLLLSCEIALVAPFFLYAFPWMPYKIGSVAASDRDPKPQHYHGGFLGIRALLAAANVFDIFIALARGIMAKFGKGSYSSRGPSQPTYYVPSEYGGVGYRGVGQGEEYVMAQGVEGARNY